MQINVLLFATLKDKAGSDKVTVELPEGANIRDLKQVLSAQYPNLAAQLPSVLVAINQEFAFEQDTIPEKAELALFPPVSGGSESGETDKPHPTILKVTSEELDLDDLTAAITCGTTGAVCLFTGVVRGKTRRGDAHETVRLEYEAYTAMAEAKMAQVADEIRSRWSAIEGIAIVQRIGVLMPGTPTVLIACASAHRDTGVFEAARYGIDRLKEIVPIWKKEIGPGGESWVEGEYIPHKGD